MKGCLGSRAENISMLLGILNFHHIHVSKMQYILTSILYCVIHIASEERNEYVWR
jgi:hypothetical protein